MPDELKTRKEGWAKPGSLVWHYFAPNNDTPIRFSICPKRWHAAPDVDLLRQPGGKQCKACAKRAPGAA